MYRLLVAYRYVFSRFITFVALLFVTYSVMVLITVVSVMEGFRSELERRIRGTSSDVKVESKLFVGLRNPRAVEALLRDVEGVEATMPTLETLALHRAEHVVLPSLNKYDQDTEDRFLTAVDLTNPHAVAEANEYVRAVALPDRKLLPAYVYYLAERVFEKLPRSVEDLFSRSWIEDGLWELWKKGLDPPNTFPPPVVLGVENLRREYIFPGDRIHLTSVSPVTRRETTGEFLVVGYFKTGLYEVDAKGMILSLEDAAEFLSLRGSDGSLRVSGIQVTADEEHRDAERLDDLKRRIDGVLAENDVLLVQTQTWREARASLLQAVKVEKSIVSLILAIVIVFAGFMIFIILTVQVVEKTRDIGVLQSLGATSQGVASIFFSIGTCLCVTGLALGTVYGVGFAASINTIQRWIKLLTGLEVFPADVYYLDHIPVRFEPGDLISIVVPTVAVSLLASVVPAIRATRKDPAITLRYE